MGIIIAALAIISGLMSGLVTGLMGALGIFIYLKARCSKLMWLALIIIALIFTSIVYTELFNWPFPEIGGGNDYDLLLYEWSIKAAVMAGAPGASLFLSSTLIYILMFLYKLREK